MPESDLRVPEIIENGYLYIAQPPLYKIKKGREEHYLRDDKEMSETLIRMGSKKLKLNGTIRELVEDELFGTVMDIKKYRDLFDRMSSNLQLYRLIQLMVQHEVELVKIDFVQLIHLQRYYLHLDKLN